MSRTIEPQALVPPCVMCKHLRAKEMFYNTGRSDEDRYKNSIFWCLRTQEIFGPDGDLVGRTECSSGRSCYSQ
jgi:hypothetical protein